MSVSVALSPTPTTSTLEDSVIFVCATLDEASEFAKAGGTADSVKTRRPPEFEARNEKKGQGGGAQNGGGPPMEREARGARHRCKNREDTGGHGNHEPVQRAP